MAARGRRKDGFRISLARFPADSIEAQNPGSAIRGRRTAADAFISGFRHRVAEIQEFGFRRPQGPDEVGDPPDEEKDDREGSEAAGFPQPMIPVQEGTSADCFRGEGGGQEKEDGYGGNAGWIEIESACDLAVEKGLSRAGAAAQGAGQAREAEEGAGWEGRVSSVEREKGKDGQRPGDGGGGVSAESTLMGKERRHAVPVRSEA